MNKAELIEFVSTQANLSKADAEKAINAVIAAITTTLKKGLQVVLVGFGTFKVSQRAARKGRNPQTGKEIDIPAQVVATFKAGKTLKDAVNE